MPTPFAGLRRDCSVFLVLIWAEKRFQLGFGRLFALYVAAYTVGRVWIEALRVDHANHILGLRLNVWTSILIFLAAVAFLIRGRRGQPDTVRDEASLPKADSRNPSHVMSPERVGSAASTSRSGRGMRPSEASC